jgi:two-component system chemotaxis sensor kinase CheA
MLPGFSTKDVASDVSGRGVGMDVVKTNIQKLNGRSTSVRRREGFDLRHFAAADAGHPAGSAGPARQQPFAVPLSMVREILPIRADAVQEVGGRATMVVRGEVMPMYRSGHLLGWPQKSAPSTAS